MFSVALSGRVITLNIAYPRRCHWAEFLCPFRAQPKHLKEVLIEMEEPKTQQQEDFYYSADPRPLNEMLGAAPGWRPFGNAQITTAALRLKVAMLHKKRYLE